MNQLNPLPSPGGSPKLVIVALALALFAAIATNLYIHRIKQQVREQSIYVYRLLRDVRPGDRMTTKIAEPIEVPKKLQDSYRDALDKVGFANKIEVEARFRASAPQGDIMTYSMFLDPEIEAAQITLGMRRVTIPVNSRSVPGSLRPGMTVDIEAPFYVGPQLEVLPVMEHVKVLALGRFTIADEHDSTRRRRPGSYSSIEIEVTPEEATLLSTIKRRASVEFELHLRNPGDLERPKIPGGGINPQVLDLIESRSSGFAADPRRR